MKYIYFSTLIALMLLASCASMYTVKSINTTSFAPTSVELKLTLDDFEYIGDDTVSVTYNTYFGMFHIIHNLNNKEVARRNVNVIQLYGRQNLPVNGRLKRALFASHIKYPNAEFIIPVSTITETQQMVFGSKNKMNLRVKAYKLKK
jgi:hypothetical protein